MTGPDSRAPWHVLLGPLPAGVKPRQTPVGTPEILASPEGSAIAGWHNIVLDLSAGEAGSRILLVVLDAEDRPISASDHVLYRVPSSDGSPAHIEQLSIGGRIETDGRFNGTHWHVAGPEPPDDAEPQWAMTPRPPTAEEAARLRSLVEELRTAAAAGDDP